MKNEMTMTNAVTLHFWQSSIGPICSLRRLRSDLMCVLLVFCEGGKSCRVGGGRNKEVKLPLSFFFFLRKMALFLYSGWLDKASAEDNSSVCAMVSLKTQDKARETDTSKEKELNIEETKTKKKKENWRCTRTQTCIDGTHICMYNSAGTMQPRPRQHFSKEKSCVTINGSNENRQKNNGSGGTFPKKVKTRNRRLRRREQKRNKAQKTMQAAWWLRAWFDVPLSLNRQLQHKKKK